MVKQTPKKITSLQHPLVKHLVKVRKERSYREESQTVFVPGETLIAEIAVSLSPLHVVATKENPNLAVTHLVSDEIMKKITGAPSPQEVAAEFPRPKSVSLTGKSFLLVMDRISDPGNMGTLLRTALAFGWEGVFLLPDAVDLFSEKVIRASRGACFRLPFQEGSWPELYAMAEKKTIPLLLADTTGTSIEALGALSKAYLILSHEGKGPSSEGEKKGLSITIPMPGAMESLNVAVAGGILLYLLKGLHHG